jgi:hypothetical protein
MSQFKAALITACLCGGLASPAVAAKTEVLELTFDTSFLSVDSDVDGFAAFADLGGFNPPFSFDLAVGDFLDLTIDFAGNQTITIDGLDSIFPFTSTNTVTAFEAAGTFQFLDADGNVLLESQKTSVEGFSHFGQAFFSEDFQDLPASITFSGVRYVGEMLSVEQDVASITYDKPGFQFGGVSFTTAVPEPGTWALMLAGVGLLGAAAARRRRG